MNAWKVRERKADRITERLVRGFGAPRSELRQLQRDADRLLFNAGVATALEERRYRRDVDRATKLLARDVMAERRRAREEAQKRASEREIALERERVKRLQRDGAAVEVEQRELFTPAYE